MAAESLKIFKALADQSRLLIVSALMEKPQYVEALAEMLQVSASTVSFHLKKLEEAELVYSVKEQYYANYHLKQEIFNSTLTDLIYVEDVEKQAQEERIEKYRQGVIEAFFEYGKLKAIPVQRKKKRIVLEEMAKSFEKGKIYTEKEVNITIADFNDDFCTIRRDMISEGIFERDKGMYWLVEKE
jgi:ArsR family transcriptional regulator, arsenate/arsenite/antimonite-responsive transcriptional repressor